MIFRKIRPNFTIKILFATALFLLAMLFLMSQFGLWEVLAMSKSAFEISIFFILMTTFIIAYFLVRDIMNPIRDITKVASKMAEGDLDQKININTRDEIGVLAQSINLLAQRLKENIEEITEEKNKLQAILSSVEEGVIAVDKKGDVILVNPVVEKLFNTTNDFALGKNIIEIIRNYELESLFRQALEKEEAVSYEMPFLIPERRKFRLHLTPLRKNDNIVGIVAILRDVTELRRLEKIRSQFVANVSHELRTPLTSIKGFVETLLDGAIEEKDTARNFLEIINSEAERLSRLINDVLSLSKIETKRTEIEKIPLQIADVINKVVALLSPIAQNKKIELSVDLSSALPIIEADEDMMGQVIINLTENALKYTPTGGQVQIKAIPFDNGVKIMVKDTGIGIPEKSLPRLFERFYRVDKARSREMGGTGLGLAIVKHIVEAHEGTIEVESQLNHGSVFSIYLPKK